MILHHYPDKSYAAKFIRYLKIWFLVAVLLGAAILIHSLLAPKASAFSLGSVFNTLKCVQNIKGLHWDSNLEPDLAYYNIYRGKPDTQEVIAWKFLGNTEHTHEKTIKFSLGQDDKKTLYFYRVTAVNKAGLEGPPSKPISCLKP